MSSAKRLLFVAPDGAGPHPLDFDDHLRASGFDLRQIDDSNPDLSKEARLADAILLGDLSQPGPFAFELANAARSLRSALHGGRQPIIAVATDGDASDGDARQIVDDVIEPPFDISQLVSRIAALQRLSTMREELGRRRATAADYGLDLPEPDGQGEAGTPSILIVGSGPRFGRLETLVSSAGTVVGSLSSESAIDYLLYHPFDLVIVDMPDAEAANFVADMRRNPRFHDLPVVMVADGLETEEITALYALGLTDMLALNGHETAFLNRAATLIGEHQLREKLRASYRAARHLATSDALTGLYSRGFLLDHLTRMVGDAERHHEPLAVAAFRIGNLGDVNTDLGYPAGDRIIRQVGDMLINLVRGEDLTARWGGGTFIVVLTATRPEDAVTAMRRLSAIIEATTFSLDGLEQTVKIDMRQALVEFTPGESAEHLVRRAILITEEG
ncbi:MAG: hypothetical protein C0606_03245 [Hyphomicrobiales bacterium]|nr:MAG: hypothetical protein C0606_03245 [Hyphomicrobiales bacterium]